MLKLICGPSGAGKTELLVRAIEADVASAVRCFLLVPEQQAYISERDLTARLPGSAGRYLEIVNFSRTGHVECVTLLEVSPEKKTLENPVSP